MIKNVITYNKIDFDKVELYKEKRRDFEFVRMWKAAKVPELASDRQLKFRVAHWNIQAQKLTNKQMYPHV